MKSFARKICWRRGAWPARSRHGKRRRWFPQPHLTSRLTFRRGFSGCIPAGFTLLELVAVLALIVLLLGLGHQGWSAARQQAALQQARTELAAIAVALESFRRSFGAYPQAHDGPGLWAALNGTRGPLGEPISGRRLADAGTFNLRWPDPDATGNELLDPWGQPYRYRSSGTGPEDAYLLYSVGPDERAQPPDENGQVNDAHPDNRDNLYAHRR